MVTNYVKFGEATQSAAYTGEFIQTNARRIAEAYPVDMNIARDQDYYISRIAEDTGTEHFDVVAERAIVAMDKRIKRKERGDGTNDYYYRFRSPLTKFRGFFGTLTFNYWPMAILMLLIFTAAMKGGLLDSGALGLHKALPEIHEATTYGKREHMMHPIHQDWDLVGTAKGLTVLTVVLATVLSLRGIYLNYRYFFLVKMTGRRTLTGMYAHFLILFFAILSWIVLATVSAFSYHSVFGWLTHFLGNLDHFGPIMFDLLRSTPELFAMHPGLATSIVVAPVYLMLTLPQELWGVVVFSFLTLGVWQERKGRFANNAGIGPIMNFADQLERAGLLTDGLREQARVRTSIAWYATQKPVLMILGSFLPYILMWGIPFIFV